MKARFLLWLLRTMAWMPTGWRLKLGALTGWFACRIARRRMDIVLRNLELCFPEMSPRERAQMATLHMRALAQTVLDRGVFWFGSQEKIRRLVSVSGQSRIEEMLAEQGSVMLLAPHFIGLDAAATRLTMDGPAGATIYTPQRDPDIDAIVRAGRSRFHQVHLVSRKEGVRPLVRHVQNRIPIYYLPDMDFGRQDSAFVPFFGVPAATLLAPSRLARMLNMVVQPVIAEMLPGGQGYKVHFMPPLDNFPTADTEADTLRLNQYIEQQILKNPSQYLWVHKRFKTRPEGEAGLY